MITGQSYDDDVKLIIRKDEVEWCSVEDSLAAHLIFNGVGAVKMGHALIAAGEEALEKAGKVHGG